jgi:hypothetical protein
MADEQNKSFSNQILNPGIGHGVEPQFLQIQLKIDLEFHGGKAFVKNHCDHC